MVLGRYADDLPIVDLLKLDPLVAAILRSACAFPGAYERVDHIFLSELHAVGYEEGETVYAMPVMVDGDVEGFVGVFAFHAFSVRPRHEGVCRL